MKRVAEKLVERLEEIKSDNFASDVANEPYSMGICHTIEKAIGIVNRLAEEYQKENDDTDYANIELYNFWQKHQWIPVSERLPKPGKRYLVTGVWKDGDYRSYNTYDSVYGSDGLWHGHNYEPQSFEVVAWMPLPEPYKESEG